MSRQPSVEDLADAVVSVRDSHGHEGRYVVDRLGEGTLVCSYVFRGRQAPPISCRVGDLVELGTGGPHGWIVATGRVSHVVGAGGITITVDDVRLVQRRDAYREELIVPFTAVDPVDRRTRRGRTENLSTGGFAARLSGTPIPDGDEVLVRFDLPDRDEVTAISRKVGGDLQQRFEFVNLDRRTEDRIARLVREAELDRQRKRL